MSTTDRKTEGEWIELPNGWWFERISPESYWWYLRRRPGHYMTGLWSTDEVQDFTAALTPAVPGGEIGALVDAYGTASRDHETANGIDDYRSALSKCEVTRAAIVSFHEAEIARLTAGQGVGVSTEATTWEPYTFPKPSFVQHRQPDGGWVCQSTCTGRIVEVSRDGKFIGIPVYQRGQRKLPLVPEDAEDAEDAASGAAGREG